MTDLDRLRQLTLMSLGLAAVIGIASSFAFFAAFGWDIEAATFGVGTSILGRGLEAAALFRWGALGDLFYSYLLLLPLALYTHRRLRERGPWLADIGLAGALAYIFIGGAAAAILAHTGSALVEAYSTAAPTEQPAIARSWQLLRDSTYFAIWQTLDTFTSGVWVLTAGWLQRGVRSVLAPLLVTLGLVLWTFGVMTMLGVHSLAVVGGIGIVGLVGWLAWVGYTRWGSARTAT